MNRGIKLMTALAVVILTANTKIMASGSFICQEPVGKRLIQIDGKDVSKPGGKILIYIDGNDLLLGDIHAKAFLVVDEDRVARRRAAVNIANFDGDDSRY